jgi:hypothetical protein
MEGTAQLLTTCNPSIEFAGIAGLLNNLRGDVPAARSALRQRRIVLQRKVKQRSPVPHPAVSLVSVDPQAHRDYPAKDPGALWISPLLVLEIPLRRRPAANPCGIAGVDLADER